MNKVFFVIFFSVGAAALSVSILCDEMIRHYDNARLLDEASNTTKRLKSLNADYQALLEQIDRDPCLVNRLVAATFGAEPNDPNTITPKVSAKQKEIVRQVLEEDNSGKIIPSEKHVPELLAKISVPYKRIVLFLAGSALILISFIFFSSKQPS